VRTLAEVMSVGEGSSRVALDHERRADLLGDLDHVVDQRSVQPVKLSICEVRLASIRSHNQSGRDDDVVDDDTVGVAHDEVPSATFCPVWSASRRRRQDRRCRCATSTVKVVDELLLSMISESVATLAK